MRRVRAWRRNQWMAFAGVVVRKGDPAKTSVGATAWSTTTSNCSRTGNSLSQFLRWRDRHRRGSRSELARSNELRSRTPISRTTFVCSVLSASPGAGGQVLPFVAFIDYRVVNEVDLLGYRVARRLHRRPDGSHRLGRPDEEVHAVINDVECRYRGHDETLRCALSPTRTAMQRSCSHADVGKNLWTSGTTGLRLGATTPEIGVLVHLVEDGRPGVE